MESSKDAYYFLGVKSIEDDETIRQAFHEQLKSSPDDKELFVFYDKIKTEEKRYNYRWNKIDSFVVPPPFLEEDIVIPIEELTKELAFLSDWEVGDL